MHEIRGHSHFLYDFTLFWVIGDWIYAVALECCPTIRRCEVQQCFSTIQFFPRLFLLSLITHFFSGNFSWTVRRSSFSLKQRKRFTDSPASVRRVNASPADFHLTRVTCGSGSRSNYVRGRVIRKGRIAERRKRKQKKKNN